MSNNDRRTSLSPSERVRSKSQSSTRSHRTTPNIGFQDDEQRNRMSSRSSRDHEPGKRSESSASTRSTKNATPTSKKRPNVKTPTSPPRPRRSSSKQKKSAISITESERRHLAEDNNDEQQNLTAAGLAMVPAEIFELKNLRRLILSNNNLSGLPPTIGSLIFLEYLDVSHNPLLVRNGHDDYSCFPKEFRHLKTLKTLLMSECRVKHIPAAVWFVVSLQRLDLSRNKVGFIMGEIGNLNDLRHLRLSHMNLDTLPAEIGFCEKLETLDLIGNPIDTLPETLVECRQLSLLKINYKTFFRLLDPYMLQLLDEGKIRSEHIPQVIFELENLRLLDLSRTKINSIPNQHSLLNLRELYLAHNTFFDIPEAICNIEHLQILDVSHNRITAIPDYFHKMKHLTIFLVVANKLTILPRYLTQISTIEQIVADHNQIHLIEKEIGHNRSLLKLTLSDNNLTAIPVELCQLKQLETLDLRYNKITHLPLIFRQLIGLKSMNIFDEFGERVGLHLSGNVIVDPPSLIWKSTEIATLFHYLEDKENDLAESFYHLKIIFIGAKNVGKTTLAKKIVDERKIVTKTRKTLETFVSILQQNRIEETLPSFQNNEPSQITSSSSTDQWIENRISTSEEETQKRSSKKKRLFPPPLKTYRSTEIDDFLLHKSTFITKTNFYCTIFDLTSEPNFEILYPLIYDTKALFILPVNLTNLMKFVQAATSIDGSMSEENQSNPIDLDVLLTNDWLEHQLFRYIRSIVDHCDEVFLSIVGLIDRSINEHYEDELLDRIHSKVDEFLRQRNHVHLYSHLFPRPLALDDENIAFFVIEQLESLAHQWNFIHHKQKRLELRRHFAFIPWDCLLIDYDTCRKQFDQHRQTSTISSSSEDDEDEIQEEKKFIRNQIEQINFEDSLDYLKLIGEILCVGPKSQMTLIVKPFDLLNQIFARTIFRSHLNQWLNYDQNPLFRYSGFFPTEEVFQLDRQRLLTRGEFTWNMLNVLFFAQNNDQIGFTESNILDYCRLMERLCLGFLNHSNFNDRPYTQMHFVCPWFLNEESTQIDARNYFKTWEQIRQFDILCIERSRRVKQQHLWFSMDSEQDASFNEQRYVQISPKQSTENLPIVIPDLPKLEDVQIIESQIFNSDPIETMKIFTNNENSSFPTGFYERLLICLNPLFHERLDYRNLTLGRTIEKNFIQIKRNDEENPVELMFNRNLILRIEKILRKNLFSFYPKIDFRIET